MINIQGKFELPEENEMSAMSPGQIEKMLNQMVSAAKQLGSSEMGRAAELYKKGCFIYPVGCLALYT